MERPATPSSLAWLLIASMAAPPAAAATLTVRVANVRSAAGRVHVDICAEADFLKESCAYSGDAPAQAGETIVAIRNLPPGRYAAQLFHDEDGDGRLDRALLGVPKEGVGFSNDAPIRLAPPRFAAAAFAIGPAAQTIAVRMRYFMGASGPPRTR